MRHLCGKRLGALVGPDEIVADGGGHRVLEFCSDLGPVLRRIAAVDDLLGVLGDCAEPAAQVVVHVGGQIGDAVVEHLLPQRRLLQRVLRLLLAPLQIARQPLAGFGIVERRQLGADRSVKCSAAEVISASTRSRIRSFSRGQHLFAEELDDGWEVRLLVEFLVVASGSHGCAVAMTSGSSVW